MTTLCRSLKRKSCLFTLSVICQMAELFCPQTKKVLRKTIRRQDFKGDSCDNWRASFQLWAGSVIVQTWCLHVISITIVPEVMLAKEAMICYARMVMATKYDCWIELEASSSLGRVFKRMKENGHKAKS